jgi:signal transduction histidine kinase
MNLQMRDLNDLRVLQPARWLTPQRFWLLSGGAGMVLLLLLAWTWLLRREVIRRGARLAEEISARNAAGLEFATRLNERKRLAGDLHDTLEQALTGLSLQLQASELLRHTDPERSTQHLRLARQFLDRSREDVHRTVWDLRAHGLDGRSLMVVLRERALAMVAGRPEKITVESEGETVALPDFIAGNLLLLAQEAVTNALKHAGAHSITARIIFLPDGVTVRVTDDGAGFDPLLAPGQSSGHFGLQGMRERMKRIGGTLQIESRTGAGTRIEASVPARAFAAGPPEPQKVAVRPMAETDEM